MKSLPAPHLTNLLKDGLVYYRFPDTLASRYWLIRRPSSPALLEQWSALLDQARQHAKITDPARSFGWVYATRVLLAPTQLPHPTTVPTWTGEYLDLEDLHARINARGDVVSIEGFQPGYLLALVRAGFRLGACANLPCAIILDGDRELGLLMKLRDAE